MVTFKRTTWKVLSSKYICVQDIWSNLAFQFNNNVNGVIIILSLYIYILFGENYIWRTKILYVFFKIK